MSGEDVTRGVSLAFILPWVAERSLGSNYALLRVLSGNGSFSAKLRSIGQEATYV